MQGERFVRSKILPPMAAKTLISMLELGNEGMFMVTTRHIVIRSGITQPQITSALCQLVGMGLISKSYTEYHGQTAVYTVQFKALLEFLQEHLQGDVAENALKRFPKKYRAIYKYIINHRNQNFTVADVISETYLYQSLISTVLRELEEKGFVTSSVEQVSQKGFKRKYYRSTEAFDQEMNAIIQDFKDTISSMISYVEAVKRRYESQSWS